MRNRVLLAGLFVSALGASAGAAELVRYQFGVAGQETTTESSVVFQPTTTAVGASATAITDPNNTVGLESSSATVTPANAPYLRLDPQGNSANAAAAVANNKYFQFTLSALLGNELDLTGLLFDAARGGAGTPRGYVVRSSVDNFAADLATADLATVRPAYTAVSVPLSGAAFQDLSSITFRVYSYSPAGGSSVDYDNIRVEGAISTIVPEPASLSALAMSAVLLGRRRRR